MSASSSKVRWGVLSTAAIATKVSKAMHGANNADPVAVASRNLDKAKAWGKEHNVGIAYGSYEELLDSDVDAVYIGLPPSMHHEWTIKAAEKGKHVLCEKPLAMNAAEVKEMAHACEQHKVQFMDGVMWVHHARAAEMHTHINASELGEIRRMTSAFCFNWDEVPETNIRVKRELGGGCLGDLGWYNVRAIWWALGEMPQRVYATAKFVNDCTYSLSAILWFNNNRMASFDCAFDIGDRQWLEVAGTEGNLVCDDFVVPWHADKARYWLNDCKGQSREHVVNNCIQEQRMIENFSQHVLFKQINTQWVTDALNTQIICDAIDKSARTEKAVDLK